MASVLYHYYYFSLVPCVPETLVASLWFRIALGLLLLLVPSLFLSLVILSCEFCMLLSTALVVRTMVHVLC